jgi:Helix-turn-helix domain
MERQQAFKFELRENGEQRRQMRRCAGSVRFVHNHALALQKEMYELTGKAHTRFQLDRLLTLWRIGMRSRLHIYPNCSFGHWQYWWLWQASLPYRSWPRLPSDAMVRPSFSAGFAPYATRISFSPGFTTAASAGLAKKFGLFVELTVLRRMDVLAERLVPWEPLNHEQRLALLANRTKPARTASAWGVTRRPTGKSDALVD